jgi:hypothetical protein
LFLQIRDAMPFRGQQGRRRRKPLLQRRFVTAEVTSPADQPSNQRQELTWQNRPAEVAHDTAPDASA